MWPGTQGLVKAPEAELKSHCVSKSDKAATPLQRTVPDSVGSSLWDLLSPVKLLEQIRPRHAKGQKL